MGLAGVPATLQLSGHTQPDGGADSQLQMEQGPRAASGWDGCQASRPGVRLQARRRRPVDASRGLSVWEEAAWGNSGSGPASGRDKVTELHAPATGGARPAAIPRNNGCTGNIGADNIFWTSDCSPARARRVSIRARMKRGDDR